jgi:hypothetical protein
MFRALFAHHQETLHIRLVYCVRFIQMAASRIAVELPLKLGVEVSLELYKLLYMPPEDKQLVLETCSVC